MMAIHETPTVDADEIAPRRVDRRAAWATAAAALVMTAGVVWFALDASHEPVRWSAVGYRIVSPTEAVATFDVYLYDDGDAQCRVRALNERFAEVGYADVPVSLADGRQQRIDATIVTVEPAVTAVVAYCEAL
jgi:hypothetical protein